MVNDGLNYFSEGFLGLQIVIEKVLARVLTGVADFNDTVINLIYFISLIIFTTSINNNCIFILQISLQSFPYPKYYYSRGFKRENFQNFIGVFAFFMIFMIPTITRNVVGEKQSGMTVIN